MSHGSPLYVYGVTRSKSPLPRRGGIDGREIRSVSEDGVAAVVSEVPPGDVEATRERLMAHAAVLEEIGTEATVLPMRFGVVAPSEEALREAVLGPRRRVFTKLLRRLDGLVEMGVRVFYEQDVILREIVKRSPGIRRLQQAVRGRSADATYYDRIRLGEAITEAMAALAEQDAARLYAAFRPHAQDARARQPSLERMVMNGAFLVRREDLERFASSVDATCSGDRFHLRLTGPMPAYSFVDLEIEPARGKSWAS